MRQQIGYLMQLLALGFVPLLIVWQLVFSFRLILMPALLLVGAAVFWVGRKLSEG
jgi:hypothetical protein